MKSREYVNKRESDYYFNNPDQQEKRKQRALEWRKKNPEKFKASSKKTREKIKEKIFSLYGCVCSICGFEDKRALSVDHIKGNGAEERRQIGRWGYLKRASTNYLPDEYRILCMNCQFIENFKRMYEGRE